MSNLVSVPRPKTRSMKCLFLLLASLVLSGQDLYLVAYGAGESCRWFFLFFIFWSSISSDRPGIHPCLSSTSSCKKSKWIEPSSTSICLSLEPIGFRGYQRFDRNFRPHMIKCLPQVLSPIINIDGSLIIGENILYNGLIKYYFSFFYHIIKFTININNFLLYINVKL